MGCLSEESIADFVEGRIPPDLLAEVDAHLSSCTGCRLVVAEVAAGMSQPTSSIHVVIEDTGPPKQLGRYEVLRTLGVGGMGVVYEAYDPSLNRRIALKVMRADRTLTDEAQARLLREARAMALVSHPNVATVHDVGVVDRQVFVAMEFVDGQTLKALMKTKPPWREVYPLLVQAGEGLVAAHAAGLVHRDFKPENVLLGKDGRVRVTDFGLARLATRPDPDVVHPTMSTTELLTTVTRTDLFIGTPAYMAPEQFAGKLADSRSDQFAFAVALHEALFGARPFKGADLEDLRKKVLAGEMIRTTGSKGGSRLRNVIMRGLATDAEDRHGSMRELLDALARAEKSSSAPWLAVGALVLAGASIAGAWQLRQRTSEVPPVVRASDPAPLAPSAIATPVGSPATTPIVRQTPAATTTNRPVHVRPAHTARTSSALKPFDEEK